MPTFRVNTPNHNETVQADKYTRDDHGDRHLYNASVSDPVATIPDGQCEGVFREDFLV